MGLPARSAAVSPPEPASNNTGAFDIGNDNEDKALAIATGAIGGALLGALIGHCLWDQSAARRASAAAACASTGTGAEEDRAPRRQLRLRQGEHPAGRGADPQGGGHHPEGQRALKVSVEGHTDSKGSDDYNLKLSMRRAAAVKAFLVQEGVAESRLSTRGPRRVPTGRQQRDRRRSSAESSRRAQGPRVGRQTSRGGAVSTRPTSPPCNSAVARIIPDNATSSHADDPIVCASPYAAQLCRPPPRPTRSDGRSAHFRRSGADDKPIVRSIVTARRNALSHLALRPCDSTTEIPGVRTMVYGTRRSIHAQAQSRARLRALSSSESAR